MTAVPPEPLHVEIGGSLRIAVGSPGGLRSSTWLIRGSRSRDDVYIGPRSVMGMWKLSLHGLVSWRLARTAEYAKATGLDEDRLLYEFTPPDEFAPGWRRGATICVPGSSLRAPFPETPMSGPVSWWPAPGAGYGLRFDVMLGQAGCDDAVAVHGAAGEVGRIQLPDGAHVWVVTTETAEPPAEQLRIVRERAATLAETPADADGGESAAWGPEDGVGVPVMYDLGDPGASAGSVGGVRMPGDAGTPAL
jgi:hypothetical protein